MPHQPPLDPRSLRPGDVLLYAPERFLRDPFGALVGDAIAVATKKFKSHAEVVSGQPPRVFAARISGVNYYPVRLDACLACVRRHPRFQSFNAAAADAAVRDLIGTSYEATSFLSYFFPWRQPRHVARVCSPVVVEYLRAGGLDPVNPDCHPSKVTPGDLWVTGSMETLWRHPSLDRRTP